MNFDKPIDRRGTHSSKWDMMEKLFGVSPEDGLAMWTADSDYQTAPCVIEAARQAVERGVFGYTWEHPEYLNAVQWWMRARHGWEIDTDWVLTTQGLGNAVALSLHVWSEPGDHVVIFTPVYHEFAVKIGKTGRRVRECPLARDGDRYILDLDDAQSRLDGSETLLIFCSPQNPSGRVWTAEELRAVADFAERNDLTLVVDEIHHDLVYSGTTFVPFDLVCPEARPRTALLTAASKTFNIAGQRTGNMILPDPEMRNAMRKKLLSLDYKPGTLALEMITAAYSPDGADWADAQMVHLEGNRQILDAAINAIPGVKSMPLQSTYLAWIDFEGTGMEANEIAARIRDDARIAVSPGPAFGTGGELFQRINFATQRSNVEEAARRLTAAFADLQ